MKTIYAIRDRIANDLAGAWPLVVMRTDAQAVRYFQDSLAMEKSALALHPRDYDLITCGKVTDEGELLPLHGGPAIVITGEALLAAQERDQQPQDTN